MNRLFKKARQTAKENLIDKAVQANVDSESPDPQAQLSAIDFDAELKALTEQSTGGEDLNATPESTDGAPPPDGGDGTGETPEGGEPGAAQDGQPPESEDNPDEEGDKDKPKEGEEEPVYEPEPGDKPDTDLATECIARLVRCIEVLDEQHENGIVTPITAGLINNEADRISQTLALDIPPAPALENNTAENRYTVTRKRVVEILRKALQLITEWWNKLSRWIGEFIATNRARNGVYPKTLEGFKRRMSVINDFHSDTMLDVPLGTLSHNFNTNTPQDLTRSAILLLSIAGNTCSLASKVSPQDYLSIGNLLKDHVPFDTLDQLGTNPASKLRFPSVVQTYKITPATNGITEDASVDMEFKDRTGTEAGFFKLTHMPGGKSISWKFGHTNKTILSFEDAIKQLQVFAFETTASQVPNTSLNVALSVEQANSFAALGEKFVKVSQMPAGYLKIAHQHLSRIRKISEVGIAQLKDQPQLSMVEVQNIARMVSLWASAFERCYVLPIIDAARYVEAGTKQTLMLTGTLVAKIEEELKNTAQ